MKKKFLVRLNTGPGHVISETVQPGQSLTAYVEGGKGSRLEFDGQVVEILAEFDLSKRERFLEAQAALGMDNNEAAGLLQIDPAAVAGWARGKTEAPGSCVRLLEIAAWFRTNHPPAWDDWLDRSAVQE
jgi:hypothetical protein